MIKWERYLKDIRPFYDEDLIKVIIGRRRSGKSILLEQIVSELSTTIDKKYIIYINFEDVSYSDIEEFKDLNNYIIDLIKDEKILFIIWWNTKYCWLTIRKVRYKKESFNYVCFF